MKNLLAMVQALARQTEAEGRSGEQYRDAFLGRLEALARAHELAFGTESVDLAALVGGVLEPYAAGTGRSRSRPGRRWRWRGGRSALALMLHELATNAVKHGALSAPAGRVRVGWEVEEAEGGGRRLRLRWEERGGPRVGPPVSRGFGTRLIEFARRTSSAARRN